MLQRSSRCIARAKFGQKAWSPNASSGGAAPNHGVTAQEALQIAYRPMPPEQTVEYEEDFGNNMIIHREFLSKRGRSAMSHNISAMAYSDLELRRAREQLATSMNRERRGVAVGMAGETSDRVHLHTDLDPEARDVASARFLFNEERLAYCDRFQRFFDRVRGGEEASSAEVAAEHPAGHVLFSLMEACAVVHGCSTAAARETYFRQFLRLDLESLEEDSRWMSEMKADAEWLKAQPSSLNVADVRGTTSGDAATDALLDSIPDLLPTSSATPSSPLPSVSTTTHTPLLPRDEDGIKTTTHTTSSRDEDDVTEAAPLLRAYHDHAKGILQVPSLSLETMGRVDAIRERRRWRQLMDALIHERYHELGREEWKEAVVLNNQLHTIKFFDLKVGDTTREIMEVMRRESGSGSSAHRVDPVEMSSTHPERRV